MKPRFPLTGYQKTKLRGILFYQSPTKDYYAIHSKFTAGGIRISWINKFNQHDWIWYYKDEQINKQNRILSMRFLLLCP